MMPLTNSQLVDLGRETAAKYGTRSTGSAPWGPVMGAYRVGRLDVTWVGDGAEVRDESGTPIHTGTRDECLSWAKSR